MTASPAPTQFAPAERASAQDLERQAGQVAGAALLHEYLDAVPDILMVLNPQRQVVFTNRPLMDLLGLKDDSLARGRRPGELLDCIHASETEGGCGTTEFCRTCGAVNAILASQRGQAGMQECRILQRSGEALDLRIWAKPVTIAEERYTIFTVLDIRNEKRREALERVFFHDILNTAACVRGYAELLKEAQEAPEVEQLTNILCQLSTELIEEINAQRELTAAEHNELALRAESVDAVELLHGVAAQYQNFAALMLNRPAKIEVQAQAAKLITDRTLLRRVIGNMTKNALEASRPGQVVTLICRPRDDRVAFSVHNAAGMPREVQLQVFQRSFSTKGSGRGLGTYGMKLLTERYLKGAITFTSSPETGTTFTASYPLDVWEAAPPAVGTTTSI